jgi:NAD(P)-dependent dehydrogenase (short-subunit alcohol dehydrogenase family)
VDNFKDKVAVITGAASGIGRAVADLCVREEMKVVLADFEKPALVQAQKELEATGASVLAVLTDVSKANEVEALAQNTLSAFGAAHLLFNNAGVVGGSTIWESTLADWQWVMGVNLWGVIHALRVFVPIMLAQDTECHIVNTASIAGLLPYHPAGPYQVTKHAVVALSEQLQHSLARRNAKVNTSVVCPGWVSTRIIDSERNRPPELQNELGYEPTWQREMPGLEPADNIAMPPQQVAEYMFRAIRTKQFYVLTHSQLNPVVRKHMEDLLRQPDPI